MNTKLRANLLLLVLSLLGLSHVTFSKSIITQITSINADTVTLNCGLDRGVSTGDQGTVFYKVNIGNMEKRIAPASFIIIEVRSNSAVGKINSLTGEIKTSYLAEIKLGHPAATKATKSPTNTELDETAEAQRVTEAYTILQSANSLYEAGDLDEAQREYERILKILPEDAFARVRIEAIGRQRAENMKKAAQLDYYHAAARGSMQDGDFVLAREYCEKALQTDSRDGQGQMLLTEAERKIRGQVYLTTLPIRVPLASLISPPGQAAISPPPPNPRPSLREGMAPMQPAQGKSERGQIPRSGPEIGSKNPSTRAQETNSSLMILIEAGDFMMGESRRMAKFKNEMPPHQVHMESYFIDKYEVTRGEYKRFVMESHRAAPRDWQGGALPDQEAALPVTEVAWEDAAAYCVFVDKRLPTEAEWEYAARGRDGFTYPWGNKFDPRWTNIEGSGSGKALAVTSIGTDRSPWGVIGMAGNVSEWTSDWYLPYPHNDFSELEYGEHFKVVRGGSYQAAGSYSRAAFRGYRDPLTPAPDIGFRCARPASSVPAQ